MDERGKVCPMKVLFYSVRPYDKKAITALHSGQHDLQFTEAAIDKKTVVLAHGFEAVCGFVNDKFDADVLAILAGGGTRLVLLRSTGFNNVDLSAAEANGISVMRVTYYSPYAVAEFAVTLMLALNRKIHRTYNKVREENFLLYPSHLKSW